MATYSETVTESISFTSPATTVSYATVTESLVLSEVVTIFDSIALTESIAFSEELSLTLVNTITLTDSITFSEATEALLVIQLSVTETVSLSEVQDAARLLVASVIEALGLSDNNASSLVANLSVVDNLHVYNGEVTAGDLYIAWVLNADNGAVTRYDNWAVNSGVRFKGFYLGAGEEGVYELKGENDDGADISASISLPRTDFGVPEQKGMQYAYLGVRGDGELVVRVSADNDGPYEYVLTLRSSEELENARAVIGKGLKARYFQVDIANVGGADFEIDRVALTPIPTKRRL